MSGSANGGLGSTLQSPAASKSKRVSIRKIHINARGSAVFVSKLIAFVLHSWPTVKFINKLCHMATATALIEPELNPILTRPPTGPAAAFNCY